MYYNTFPLTLYFPAQIIKVQCTANTKNAIEYALKKEPLSERLEKIKLAKKRKYYEDPEKKRQAVKKKYQYTNE